MTSLSTFEWLQLDPKMLIKLTAYEENDEPRKDAVYVGQFGGGSYIHYSVTLPRERLRAGMVIESARNPDFDYYSLVPGERAVFFISLSPSAPGKYEFSVGLEYWFGGTRQTTWTNDSFKMVVVDKYRSFGWWPDCSSPIESIQISDCQFAPSGDEFYQCTHSEFKPKP